MNCEQVQDLLNEYIDGELAAASREDVEQHVADCVRCRAELRALRQTAELVRSLPRATAPKGMTAAIKSRVARAAGIRRRAALARWVGVGGWVAAAATLFVVIKLASWEPEPAAPDDGAEERRRLGEAVSAAPDEKRVAGNEAILEKKQGAAAEGRGKIDEVAPAPSRPGERDDYLSRSDVGATPAPSILPNDAKGDADVARRAPERMRSAGAETGARSKFTEGEESALGATKFAEDTPAAQAAASAEALSDRAEADDGRKETPKPEESICELVYSCKDAASGLAEVRRLVLAAGGTLVDAEAEVDNREKGAARSAILASIPADRLGWLTERLKLADGLRGANGRVSAKRSAEAPTGPETFGAGREHAGKPVAALVRIVLKVRPKPEE